MVGGTDTGTPANFDYIAHTGAERIWSGVTDWWS